MPTSQVSERGSAITHATDTSSRDKHKTTLTRKASSGKQGLAGNLQTKSTTSITKGEAHTSRKNTQATEINSSTKVEDMATARLTGSREGIVFDDKFEGMSFQCSRFQCRLHYITVFNMYFLFQYQPLAFS